MHGTLGDLAHVKRHDLAVHGDRSSRAAAACRHRIERFNRDVASSHAFEAERAIAKRGRIPGLTESPRLQRIDLRDWLSS